MPQTRYAHIHSLSYRPRWLPFFQVENDVRVRLVVVAHPAYPVDMAAIHRAHTHQHVRAAPPAHIGPTRHAWIELLRHELLIGRPRSDRDRHIGEPCHIYPVPTIHKAALAVGRADE